MKRVLDHIICFARGYETWSFTSCFASLVICVEGYDEHWPVHCGKGRGFCNDCGQCENPDSLQRLHEQIDHQYQVISGCDFLFPDPQIQPLTHDHIADTLLNDGIDIALNYAGYSYLKLHSDISGNLLRDQVVSSIDQGIPVIVKTKQHRYQLITGYDDDGAVLYGCDGSAEVNRLNFQDWHMNLSFALVVTGKVRPSLSNLDVLHRLITILESQRLMNSGFGLLQMMEDDARFQAMNSYELHQVTSDIYSLISYLAESRNSISNAFSTSFLNSFKTPDTVELESVLSNLCRQSHDIAGALWRTIDAWDDDERLRNTEIRCKIIQELRFIMMNDFLALCQLKQYTERISQLEAMAGVMTR